MTKNDIIEPFIKLRFTLDRLSERDRAIVLFLGIACLSFIWYLISYVPHANAIVQIDATITSENIETSKLIEKKTMIENLSKDNTVTKLVDKYAKLQADMAELEHKLTRYQERFIDNKQLASLLNSILKQTTGVSIVGFSNQSVVESVPQVVVVTPPPGTTPPPSQAAPTEPVPSAQPTGPAVEQIHYTLMLKGSYFSILDYLEKLENTEWQFYWDQLNYHVDTYPDATATIQFYTLRPLEQPAAFKAEEGK